jgi:DNA-binding winged helix-turn-helix (wHTH) protein/Tol biopolymer transport system component
MDADSSGRVRFGRYELDSESGKLSRDGWPVKIQPQPLRVLNVLLERRGEIVSREQLRAYIWGDTTFVEFDQGLNYCIRQIRLALRDEASQPLYIETLPKQGYRFIAEIAVAPNGAKGRAAAGSDAATNPIVTRREADPSDRNQPDPAPLTPMPPVQHGSRWPIGVCAAFVMIGIAVYLSYRLHPAVIKYTQLTDFTDSATAPALSPDGHMVAFFRGGNYFLTADQIYVKMLPDGEAKRLTNDGRLKYNLAFSPDGSQIAYTVLESPSFATYTVSVLGGDSHLLLNNAAGLTWLDQNQLLFSRTRLGLHLGVVSGTIADDKVREIYFPPHERSMAHYSYASPDRRSALVVEMNQQGKWSLCRLISLDGRSQARPIGPEGACTSAGWSPDGSWMYFIATVKEQSHLWRQRFPNGQPAQITFGPAEEEGLAVERDGRSVITSIGVHESSIWIHDADGERALSSEGEIVADISPPSFGADDKILYYLLRHQPAGSGPELWRITVDSGKSEPVFPGISMSAYDVSPDGKQAVYSTADRDGKSQLWLAPTDRSSPAKQIGHSGETSPHFGPRGQILFTLAEANFNYLEQMNQDGSGRSKVVPYPIIEIQGISPGRKWLMAIVPYPDGKSVTPMAMAIPLDGGTPLRMCASFCVPTWSSTGKFLFIPVEASSQTSVGRSLAIPVGPAESLPQFPPGGIKPLAEPNEVPGSQSINRADLVPGEDLSHFAYVNNTVHRNIYRISLH